MFGRRQSILDLLLLRNAQPSYDVVTLMLESDRMQAPAFVPIRHA